jgi:hypothetical protein
MEPNMEIELEIIMDNITIDMIHEFCLRKLGIPEKRQHLIDTILLEKSQTNIYEFPERKLVGTLILNPMLGGGAASNEPLSFRRIFLAIFKY